MMKLRLKILLCMVVTLVSFPDAAYFSGKVVDSSSKPVPSAKVYLKNGDSTYTNNLGNFTIGSSSSIKSFIHSDQNSAVMFKSYRNVFTVENNFPGEIEFSLHLLDGTLLIGGKAGSKSTVCFHQPHSSGSIAVYKYSFKNSSSTGMMVLNQNRSYSAILIGTKVGLTKSQAVACTLWVSKQGYATKSFQQPSCEKTGITLQISISSEQPSTCTSICPTEQVCRGGFCVAEADLQYCVDVINTYRAKLKLAALARSTDLENYAAEGAKYDSDKNSAHAHFKANSNYTLTDAENEIPGWPLSSYGTVTKVIDSGTKMMWDEGPGGGHYENIKGSHTKCGCGIFITSTNKVWIIQDFK